jgi:hypothetical protein
MLELHRYGVQIVYAVDKYVHIFHAVVRGQPFIPLFMEFLPFLIYILGKKGCFMGFGLKKKGTVSALCLTVFGVIGAGAEPLAFPEALGFGANEIRWTRLTTCS